MCIRDSILNIRAFSALITGARAAVNIPWMPDVRPVSYTHLDVYKRQQESFAFIRDFEGEIPGSRREECGNYKEHDLKGAKETAVDMLEVLKDWTPEKMEYEV